MNQDMIDILFNRERFEAWLAALPLDRVFAYFSHFDCLLASFLKETSRVQAPFIGGGDFNTDLNQPGMLPLPAWARALAKAMPNTYTAGEVVAKYRELFNIDLTKRAPDLAAGPEPGLGADVSPNRVVVQGWGRSRYGVNAPRPSISMPGHDCPKCRGRSEGRRSEVRGQRSVNQREDGR